jgi:hypothetical protein
MVDGMGADFNQRIVRQCDKFLFREWTIFLPIPRGNAHPLSDGFEAAIPFLPIKPHHTLENLIKELPPCAG